MTLIARKYPKKYMDVEIIAYSKNVPFHNICSVCEHILDSNDELTPLDHTSVSGQVAPIPGYKAIYRLIGDGSHTPTFNEAFKKKDGTGSYDNTAGVLNLVSFLFDGVDYWYEIDHAG